jgi:hypothetical protein
MQQALNNKTGRLLYKLGLLAVIIVGGDFLLGKVLRYFYFKQESGLLYRTTYAMEVTHSDALIFGSSRANHHYHPTVMEQQLGMSTYNTGRDGNFILYNTAVLKSILKRYTPKVILLDLDVYTFNESPENYDRLSSLLPYYKTHEEIRDIVELKSPFEKIKLQSGVYPFNSLVFKIAVGNTEMNKARKASLNGYVALTATHKKDIQEYNIEEKIDSQLVKSFTSFITSAKAAGSKVYVVVSPIYYQYKRSQTIELARSICQNNGVAFWDYSRDTTLQQHRDWFADRVHLNDEGAQYFTKIIAEKIKQEEKK